MTDQQITQNVVQDVVRELFERGVLYTSVLAPASLRQDTYQSRYCTAAPKTITLWCSDSKCLARMEWDHGGDQNARLLFTGISDLTYSCRHTPTNRATFIVAVRDAGQDNNMRVELVGRSPRATPHVSVQMAQALGEHDRHWYSQALDARSRDMGVAAVAYMRRVVENEMNRILEFLIDQLSAEDGKPELLEAIIAARQLQGDHSFESKARTADAVLPTSFFPGNRNPFLTLHALCSEGVHLLDDTESSERFDEAKELFELLFEKLARQADDRRVFTERLKKLKPRLKS